MATAAKASKLVILGGTGFVGTAVAEEAVKRGLQVLCLSRKGATDVPGAWKQSVQFAAADALAPDTYTHQLADADALVVAIGSPPLPFVEKAFQVRARCSSCPE